MTHWLILDCNYLCHRAFHTTGSLSYKGRPTGTLYGFFREVGYLQDHFGTTHVAFCFDSHKSLRQQAFPGYKAAREAKAAAYTDEEREARQGFYQQVVDLRQHHLPGIGFQNVFVQKGYEADDVIASLVFGSLGLDDHATIVSADKDLYQLLGDRVQLWNPSAKKLTTLETFRAAWGIEPCRWYEVKCLAGCNADSVPGIPGVGELTAAKWLRGQLDMKSKAVQKILGGTETFLRNVPLVKLPYEGVRSFTLARDRPSVNKWLSVARSLGFREPHEVSPISLRNLRRN